MPCFAAWFSVHNIRGDRVPNDLRCTLGSAVVTTPIFDENALCRQFGGPSQ